MLPTQSKLATKTNLEEATLRGIRERHTPRVEDHVVNVVVDVNKVVNGVLVVLGIRSGIRSEKVASLSEEDGVAFLNAGGKQMNDIPLSRLRQEVILQKKKEEKGNCIDDGGV